MSGTGGQTNASLEGPAESTSHPLESKACPNVYWDLTNLASQVQMMSDSLAACKLMSKYRPLRKMYGMKGNSRPDATVPQTSVQVLLPPNQMTVNNQPDEEKRNLSLSHVVNGTQEPTNNKSDSDESDSGQHESDGRSCDSWNSVTEETRELAKGSSRIHLYNHQKVDTSRMVVVIRRDLKTLMKMAPSVTSLVTALSDTISHYEECGKCSEKISPSLPWILNRIQKLIKYVTTKRQGSYRWPNDLSYLRLRPTGSTPSVQGFPPKASRKFLSKLEKINNISAAEDVPGVQLLLEVKPDKTHKRFFYQAENCSVATWEEFLNFSVVQLREPESEPVVQVLLPGCKPRILLDEKREAAAVKEFAHALRLVFAFRLGFLASVLILSPVTRLSTTCQLDPSESTSSRKQSVQSNKETSVGPLQQGECQGEENTVRQNESLPKRSNDKAPYSPRNLLERVPDIVREFLREAEAEKMHDQRLQNLEVRAKGLKNLMAEVEKKQVELSKILLDLGVYSEPIIKLIDPDMLESENEVVKRVAELQIPGSKQDSVEALQMAVEDVKHKCDLKRRIIMIVMKGLRSNIPKEWWEDMVEYMLDGARSIEDSDPEKVSELVQKGSSLSGKGEKQESRLQARALRKEEQSSEEEPIVKGNVEGEDVEEYPKNRSLFEKLMAKTKDAIMVDDSAEFSTRIVAFPATGNPNIVAITPNRKLEKQVSLLNAANDRLRQEVQDLKDLLRYSVNNLQEKRISCVDFDQQRANSQPPLRASGKTINLTIQLVDKDFRRPKDGNFPNTIKFSGTSIADGLGRSPGSPAIRQTVTESLTDIKESEDEGSDSTNSNLDYASKSPTYSIRFKSDRRRSENDLNSLDDASSTVTDYSQQSSEKLRSVLRERVMVGTPHPSGHELLKKLKPVMWVPSKYVIPEANDCYQPGPSRKSVDVGHLLKKPSVMELIGNENPGKSANERELQTIPENDCSPSSSSSKGMSRAIQNLRTKVRSIHQDVMVLKSKNDRIDKLLDRLTEDALENSESYEEMEENFNRLKHQLG